MAACPTKDRDSGVSSVTAASFPDILSATNSRHRSEKIANHSQCCKSRKDLKCKESEIRLDALPESDLEALLKEAVNYRGPKDSQSGTELFQNLLREASDSRDDSPPAFHYSAAPQKRRRSRKESGGVSVPSHSTVAGSNKRGGSLQNITAHSQSDPVSRRGRKRHDTSGTVPSSPRKREGGSLPCDVARGSKAIEVKEEASSAVKKDIVIDMEGVVIDGYSTPDVSRSEEKEESPNVSQTDADKYNSSTCTAIEDMDVDSDPKSKYLDETKPIFNSNADRTVYGTASLKSAVDSPFFFSALQKSPTVITNGALEESVVAAGRRFPKRTVAQDPNDINGNPVTTNGPSSGQLPSSSLSMIYPFYSTVSNNTSHGPTNNHNTALRGRGKIKRAKAKESGILSNDLPGFRGNQDVNKLLEYIESSDSNGKKKSSVKNNGSATSSLSKIKSKDRKPLKSASAEALQQPDYDAQDSDNTGSSPGCPPDPQTPVRVKKEQEGFDLGDIEDTDFQTVTKKQRRKKRLVNGTSSSPYQQHRRSAGSQSAPSGVSKLVASVPPSEHSDIEDSDGGDSVHSLPVQHSAPLFPPSSPRDRRSDFPPLQNPVADSGFPPLSENDPCTHFLSSTSLIYPTSYADIARLVRSSTTVEVTAHLPVESTSVPSSSRSGTYNNTLKRAASLPAADTPAVVIVGQPSTPDVDVTFGFELNEQLLRLSLDTSQECGPVSNQIDFSMKYREAPEVNSNLVTQNSKEVVGFISEAWRRVERKLLDQQVHCGKPLVRMYTLN